MVARLAAALHPVRPKDYEVRDLPGQPEGMAPSYAGYMPISGAIQSKSSFEDPPVTFFV